MKKILFLLLILSFNVNAANLTDTIGAQCGEILLMLDNYDYPSEYKTIKERNSQFWALHKCLNVYKENGGSIEELNKRYLKASAIYELEKKKCFEKSNKDDFKDCMEGIILKHKQNVRNNPSFPDINISNVLQTTNQ